MIPLIRLPEMTPFKHWNVDNPHNPAKLLKGLFNQNRKLIINAMKN